MSNLTVRDERAALIVPKPRSPINIRLAGLGGADMYFIDELQKKHSDKVGFFALKWFEDNIKNRNVLIAEDAASSERIGYVLFKDKYLKREELGIIHQLNVAPHRHRGLIGASLVRAAFERAAYGCKLFCCWCAQDLQANHFWESIGFVPLAFRAGTRGQAQGGTRKEGRIHIFWQRRIREGDETTPYWYPTETTGGSLRENRIVLPIPPGTHWSDAKPMVVPGMESLNALPPAGRPKRAPKPKRVAARPAHVAAGGLWVAPPKASPEEIKAAKATEPKREKQKNDPKLVAMAREFRDRYLDEVNSGRCLPAANGKYDVSRQLAASPTAAAEPIALLNAA